MKETKEHNFGLVRNHRGEWISSSNIVELNVAEVAYYSAIAKKLAVSFSVEHYQDGTPWGYIHEVEAIKETRLINNNFSMGNNDAYYDRRMSTDLINLLKSDNYKWVIDYVKKNNELDFQTGSNKDTSWFSIYRGTGRIVMLNPNGKWKKAQKKKDVGKTKYVDCDLASSESLDKLLEEIKNDRDFDKFYIGKDGKYKEGYYQTLIARRYTLNCRPDDDLLIIDKEFVIGYDNEQAKSAFTANAKAWLDKKKEEAGLAKDAKGFGSECDFLGINRNGDLVLLELKRHEDGTKVGLSPLQIGHYDELTKAFLDVHKQEFEKVIIDMINEKVELGILMPQWDDIPKALSGNIKLAVVVGGKISERAKNNFITNKEIVGKDITYYTCDEKDGTLIKEPW